MKSHLRSTLLVILIVTLLSACNAPWASTGSSLKAREPTATIETIAPPPTSTDVIQAEPVLLDPCTIVDQEDIETLLGGEVQVMPALGTGGCSYNMQGSSSNEMTQIIISAAQGDEAKALTLLSLGILAGFSGDPSVQEEFEIINQQAETLSLTEMIERLGTLLQDTGLNVELQYEQGTATIWVVFESDAYNQGTLIHAEDQTYISINQVGSMPLLGETELTPLAHDAFDRLPTAFYTLEADQDGSLQIELGEDDEQVTPTAETELSLVEPLWVTSANAGQVTAIDPNTNTVLTTIDVGDQPSDVFVFESNAYVVSFSEQILREIDTELFEVVQTIKFDGHTMHLAAGDGAVWVVGGGGVRMFDIETGTRYGVVYADCQDVVLGGGSVWVSQLGDQQILRIDPETRKVVSTIKLDGQPAELAYGLDRLWAVLHDKREVVSIDPETEEIGYRFTDENTILGVVTDPERIWYITPRGGLYFKPETLGKGRLIAPHRPTDILYYDGSLWVSSPSEGFVTRMDLDGKTVLADIEIGTDAHALGAPE